MVAGLILGVMEIITTFVALANAPASAASGAIILFAGFSTFAVGLVINLLAKAVARILTSTTDTAVNTSPFMANDAKWRALTFQQPQPTLEPNGLASAQPPPQVLS